MEKRILITGASGLLGQALVHQFVSGGFFVFGQYHRNLPEPVQNCEWIPADFSSMDGVNDFLVENSLQFRRCNYLVNNYGPITSKNFPELNADDFYIDFHHNVITAFEVTNFFIRHTELRAVVNIGFEGVGTVRPYKKILTYAAAKASLQLLTESFAVEHEDIRFHMVSPPTLLGAKVRAKSGATISPRDAAREVYKILTGANF
ncbi:MAG: SDR family oxidoreductase [bacterium]|nr:SDR family oxidoreductase [bacterium]